jgi:hypothetical protein
MFRNNPIGSVLVSVLFVLALVTCWLSVRYFFTTKELYNIQARYQSLQSTLNAVQALANETVAYSQRNPAIDSVLQEFGVKVRSGAPQGPMPPTQPAPRPAR